jgi:hypothetical protein
MCDILHAYAGLVIGLSVIVTFGFGVLSGVVLAGVYSMTKRRDY